MSKQYIVDWSTSSSESSGVREVIRGGSREGLRFKLALEGWTEIG